MCDEEWVGESVGKREQGPPALRGVGGWVGERVGRKGGREWASVRKRNLRDEGEMLV
jgi:hypothetical protein